LDERAVCLGEVWLEGELLFTARVISGNLEVSRSGWKGGLLFRGGGEEVLNPLLDVAAQQLLLGHRHTPEE